MPRLRAALALVALVMSGWSPFAAAQDHGPLPKGPGANLVYAKCQQCHPISYVVDSAGLPDFLWADTLSLMKQLGMHVTDEEEQTLYSYLTTYMGTEPPPEPTADALDSADVDGAAVYAGSCAVCHGAEGQGTSGAFPPLSRHAAVLAAADRSYLPLVVLYGLSGAIKIETREYHGVMPAWSRLSNEEIAAVLNTVTAGWHADDGLVSEGFTPYTADEVEQARGLSLNGTDVWKRRPEVP